jgi:hypothetical protein
MKFKLNFTDLIIIFSVIIFLGIMIYLVILLKQDTLQCLSNPLEYLIKQTGANCFCVKT